MGRLARPTGPSRTMGRAVPRTSTGGPAPDRTGSGRYPHEMLLGSQMDRDRAPWPPPGATFRVGHRPSSEIVEAPNVIRVGASLRTTFWTGPNDERRLPQYLFTAIQCPHDTPFRLGLRNNIVRFSELNHCPSFRTEVPTSRIIVQDARATTQMGMQYIPHARFQRSAVPGPASLRWDVPDRGPADVWTAGGRGSIDPSGGVDPGRPTAQGQEAAGRAGGRMEGQPVGSLRDPMRKTLGQGILDRAGVDPPCRHLP